MAGHHADSSTMTTSDIINVIVGINTNLNDMAWEAALKEIGFFEDAFGYGGEYDSIIVLLNQVLVYGGFAVLVIAVSYVVYRVFRRLIFGPRKKKVSG